MRDVGVHGRILFKCDISGSHGGQSEDSLLRYSGAQTSIIVEDALMTKAVRTSEKSVYFSEATRHLFKKAVNCNILWVL